MYKQKRGKQKGQTLMEILIYVAIFGTVAASLIGIVWNVTKIHTYQIANTEVDNNLRYAMNLINDKVRGASSLESATGSTLVLKMPDNTTTTFSVTGGVLYIKEGSADPVAVISDRVAVSNLTFEKIDMAGAKGGARINLTLSYVPKEGGTTSLQKTLLSAVTRSATAISFSEDIVPSQDKSYSVGSASYNWKNGFFSGDLTVNGTLKGTILCIGTDCKTAWAQVTGVTGSGTGNYVTKWTSTGTLGNSIIYDNGTNVGIGTTSPGVTLDVVGGGGSYGAYNTALRVKGTTFSYAEILGTGNQAGLLFNRDGSTGWLAGLNAAGSFRLGPLATIDQTGLTNAKDGSTGITILSTGNVGIGTTNPGYALDVAVTGTPVKFGNAAGDNIRFTPDSVGAYNVNTAKTFYINYNGGDVNLGNGKMVMLSAGNIGIGTTSPASKLMFGNGESNVDAIRMGSEGRY
ncbi:MAG: prepilin-type N-terminal cleavage/methylation domain-containing protein, partial [bacterium]|nr:prepilin-type N-terminal cleavage/methylation domain-containing protein [bacterium]